MNDDDGTGLEAYMLPSGFESSHGDVHSLTKESLARIAELSRGRRERMMAEDEFHAQGAQLRETAADFTLELSRGLVDDEELARTIVVKSEEKAFDRVARQFYEHNEQYREDQSLLYGIKELEERRRKKLKRLQRLKDKAIFHHFWTQHQAGGNTVQETQESKEARLKTQAVNIMRKAFEYSAPPFAADPEDLWRRGITVAPDLQRNAMADNTKLDSPQAKIAAELQLPPYHEFALKKRHEYEEMCARRAAAGHGAFESPPRQPHAFQQRSSPFATFATNYDFAVPPE